MFPPRTCYKSIIFLATCAVLAQCALESSLVGAPGTAEQLIDGGGDDKNGDDTLTLHKRPSFFVGSRYGRSGGATVGSSKMRRLNVVPRNDRFFLGSRYGKRADSNTGNEMFAPYEQHHEQQGIDDVVKAVEEAAFSHASSGNGKLTYDGDNIQLQHQQQQMQQLQQQQQQQQQQQPYMMSCVYTGLRNYYRCRNVEEINNIINQLTTAQSIDDRK